MSSDSVTALASARLTATQCVAWDPCAETRAYTELLLERTSTLAGASTSAAAEVISRFGERLEFGTAGLRAAMGAGTARMNDLVVLQTAQGLVSYIIATDAAAQRGSVDVSHPPISIVLGYDHRARGTLNSHRFALITAAACLRRGVRVHLFSTLVATPLVPFAVRRLGAAAGVMVTASHNPAADNGYKVYWSHGAQITPPHDAGIAAAIAANLEPQGDYSPDGAASEATIREHPLCAPDETASLVAAYIAASAAALSEHATMPLAQRPPPLRAAYTAMHGVGAPFVRAMFAAFQLPPLVETPEQITPDPAFPTVAYPNPEEGAGALKLAMATADREGCSLILANDPDADRLAVAQWVPEVAGETIPGAPRTPGAPGAWRVFTGNEIGALLAHWAWSRHVAHGGVCSDDIVMIASTVSSKFIAALAAKEGFRFEETLTGFKWMGAAIARHEAAGRRVLFSFEEAIGFACGSVVRDKDGITAAAVFAEMAAALAAHGRTIAQHIDYLYARYGTFISHNGYIVVPSPSMTAAIFARLRNEGHYWARIGRDLRIVAVRDLSGEGFDSEAADGVPTLPTSAGAHMLTYRFNNGVTATLRASGTEPKLKWYAEASGPDASAVRQELERTVRLIVDEMLQPEVHGLARPAGVL